MSRVTIRIDGTDYAVEKGNNLLQTCLNLGLELPYFCWHPALGSVGACRQCALVQYQREEDAHGRIVMGCMTPVAEGAIFSLAGAQAAIFRAAVVESLMLNHPHDCPVCAEGGECHLQDMTVLVGHRDRSYRGRKNTHRNQYLGPLIQHEMNRCISCYRCTRYYRDYAGGTDLVALAARDHIYFGRHEEGVLESEFAGNLVEVCPTGVFTDKALANDYTRKWDLQSAPSVCVGCAVGCNTVPGERYGQLKRIHNRFNRAVNGYFLCDRGRFGGHFVNSEKRLDYPARRDPDGRFTALTAAQVLPALDEVIEAARSAGKLAGIGSPRAALEANYLLRQLVGADNFCTGINDREQALLERIIARLDAGPAHNPSLQQIEAADAILILGEDVTHTAPRLGLALRQSVRNVARQMAAAMKLEPWQDAAIRNLAQERRSPLHIVAAHNTALADVAASNTALPPAQQPLFAAQILAALNGAATDQPQAAAIARDLLRAERPLVLCGTAGGSAALLDAAADIAATLCHNGAAAMLSYCLQECNTLGVGLLSQTGKQSLAALSARAADGQIDTLLILENDLFRRAERSTVQGLLGNVACCIGLDCLEQQTLEHCHWVLPSAAFTEAEGTLVSSEGRAQRFFPVHVAAHQRRPAWHWLAALNHSAQHVDSIAADCARDCELLRGIGAAAPAHDYRNRGLKIPRQPHRYSGRTAMRADISVHEPRQPQDEESALAYSMEGCNGGQAAALLPWVWSPGWNSNQSIHKFQSEVDGPLRGGSCGVRLLDDVKLTATEPAQPDPHTRATAPVPAEPDAPAGQWQLIPRYRVFGSDELSMAAPAISARADAACVELCSEEAQALGLGDGDGVLIDGHSYLLQLDDSLPARCAAFTAGHPHTLALLPWAWVALARDPNWVRRRPTIIGSDRAAGVSHVG